jgi:hypothetical protein
MLLFHVIIRYTVQFKEDESTQSNVCLDRIRQIKTKKKKSSTAAAAAGKKRKLNAISTPTDDNDASKSDTNANATTTTPNKKKSKGNNSGSTTTSTKKSTSTTKSTTKKRKNYYGAIGYVPDTSELNLASKMGLPEGWAVNIKPNSRFTFRSPDGDLKFTSKKAVFAHLGLTPPKHGHNPLDDDEEDVVEDTDEEDDEDGETELGSSNEKKDIQQNNNGNGNDPMEIEDGDPPWRTSGHKLLGRRVEYTFLDGVTGKGTLTGWISDKDVDKEGNPGFVSERTDLPACLFHVTMDSDCPIASQDFEGYEVKEILIDDSD